MTFDFCFFTICTKWGRNSKLHTGIEPNWTEIISCRIKFKFKFSHRYWLEPYWWHLNPKHRRPSQVIQTAAFEPFYARPTASSLAKCRIWKDTLAAITQLTKRNGHSQTFSWHLKCSRLFHHTKTKQCILYSAKWISGKVTTSAELWSIANIVPLPPLSIISILSRVDTKTILGRENRKMQSLVHFYQCHSLYLMSPLTAVSQTWVLLRGVYASICLSSKIPAAFLPFGRLP